MRVLQLTDSYRPAIGGLERHVELLSSGLAARGHQVRVVTSATGSAPAGTYSDGPIELQRVRSLTDRLAGRTYLDPDRRFHPTLPDPVVVSALRRLLDEWRPDVVHAHSWIAASYLPLAGPDTPPLVVTAHDYGLICANKTLLRGDAVCEGPSLRRCPGCAARNYGPAKGLLLAGGLAATRPLLTRADRYLAVSRYVAERLRHVRDRHGREADVVPAFVPDDLAALASDTARPAWLPPEDGYLLFVGALSAHKGVHVLLDAYRRLPAPPPLCLIGTRQADTPTTLPTGVSVAVDVPHPEVLRAMAGAAMLITPSTWPEPMGMVAAEAQLVGTPVIASRIGGLAEMILDERTGILVPPGDADALATAVTRLLGDRHLRESMAAAGPAWAQRFTATEVIGRLEALLASAAANTHDPDRC